MLFALNNAGVPSVASFIHLGSAPVNQPPSATITSPAANTTVAAGQSVLFAGSGTDPDGTIGGYNWSFPGGNPASSTLASAGNVTYSAPGTYVASLTVTDNGGLVSPAATRTITVPDFSISASPASQSVLVGGAANYTTTIAGGAGFASAVSLAVTGLPAGASASFTPASVTGSGSSTLKVVTTAATAGGTYQLRITGTAGPVVHTATVTLIVAGDFSLAATPSSVTIARDGIANYVATVAGGPGFSGATTLSVTGLPKSTTAKFSPSSIVNSGSSTLSVDTRKQVPRGTYSLKITGTSGATTHSVTVTLVVQ
jgi:PKD repeat protein